jgi:ADP-ribose pyrophosphatase YjhB (NUDIX family)
MATVATETSAAAGASMYASTLAEMAKDREYRSSDNFMICCGTVTVDIRAKKVLLVHNKKWGIHQLPKGRKNIGEDLLEAALRETREESGTSPTAFSAKIGTMATPANAGSSKPSVMRDVENTEPTAVCLYPDPNTGALKLVFYFLAVADSAICGEKSNLEDREKFTTIWASPEQACQLLHFKEDSEVVKKVVKDLKASGFDMA